MVGEHPERDNQYHADNDDQDSLHVDIGSGNQKTLVDENRQIVLKPYETKISEQFQYGQADTECGDDLG